MAVTNLLVEAVREFEGKILADLRFDIDQSQLAYLQVGNSPGVFSSYGYQFVAPAGGTVFLNNVPVFMTYLGDIFGAELPAPEWTDGSFRPDHIYSWRIAEWDGAEAFIFTEGPPIDTSGLTLGLPWDTDDIAPYPYNMTATVPEASETTYGVLFGWLGIAGENWALEYSGFEDFNDAVSVDVSSLDYYASPFIFQPDTTYHWRIRANEQYYDGPNFSVPFGNPVDEELLLITDNGIPYVDLEGDANPVQEPSDLEAVNFGNRLHDIATKIRNARAQLRAWAEQ